MITSKTDSASTMSLFWIYFVGLLSVTTCSMSTSGDVALSATPDRVTSGLTKDLAVNCSVTLASDPDMATVMSIIVSKNDNSGANRGYVELAALAASNQVDNKYPSLGAAASGAIHQNDDSYLALEWTYPSDDAIGLYMCQVYGMDADGHPVVKTTITSVSKEDVQVNLVLQRLKELEVKLDERKGCCCKLHQRLDHAKDSLFEVTSEVFNGKRYALSYKAFANQAISSFNCRLSGGYLAEINDEAEYNFVMNLTKVHSRGTWVALGGTVNNHEGKWTFLESDSPLNYTHWYPGHPIKSYHCQYVTTAYGMISEPCETSALQRFLCEMPATPDVC